MFWRRKKRTQEGAFPIAVDWSRQAAYLNPEDPTLAEFKPKLDIMAEQEEAIRAILFLYWELATNWCGINGEVHLGGFDRWRWLKREADYEGGVWCTYDDALLLRQGSAVELLCEMDNEWTREDELDEQVWRVALEAGRFDHLPEVRRALAAGLQGDAKEMYEQMSVAYDEYVVAFFEMLAREGRPQTTAEFATAFASENRPRSSSRDPR